jgi:histone deacetylase 1/2
LPSGSIQIQASILENIRTLQGAPGVQMQEIPPDMSFYDDDEDEPVSASLFAHLFTQDPDVRESVRDKDMLVIDDNELYEDDSDNHLDSETDS